MPSLTLTRIALSTLLCVVMISGEADAGPLFDKIFGLNQPKPGYPVGPPVPVGAAAPGTGGNSTGGYYPANAYSSNYGGSYYSGTPGVAYYGNPSGLSNSQPIPATGNIAYYGTYYGSSLPVIGPSGLGYPQPIPSGISAATLPSQPGYSGYNANAYNSNTTNAGPNDTGRYGAARAPVPATQYNNSSPAARYGASYAPTVTYVPNYSTYANRAAVTYYRPMLTTDPKTGAQVVAMAPCTSYEYQAQRVPALGRSSLYGPTAPPQFAPPQPAALPTYTLPRGGIPLAAGTSSVVLPTVRGYAPAYSTNANPYQTFQVPLGSTNPGAVPSGVSPGGSYPTSPLGAYPYSGATSGGSCGNVYSSTVPGLTAPQAPRSVLPATPVPNATMPSSGVPGPGSSGSIYPPGGNAPMPSYPSPSAAPRSTVPGPSSTMPGGPYPGGSIDPADVPPSLPLGDTSASLMPRPQLRSITRQPVASENETQPTGSENDDMESPLLMKPIPVPDDFEHPSWSPGLLKDEDMTAWRNNDLERLRVAGQSKAIRWASFQQSDDRAEVRSNQPQGLELRASAGDWEDASSLQPHASMSRPDQSPTLPQAGSHSAAASSAPATDRNRAERPSSNGLRFIEQPSPSGGRSVQSSSPASHQESSQLTPRTAPGWGDSSPVEVAVDQVKRSGSSEIGLSNAQGPEPALQPNHRYDTSGWKPVR